MRVVRYWVRSVDCRGRVLTRGGWSVWEVLADETGREFGGKCVAEAQTKREAKDVAARLNARLRGLRNAGPRSVRKSKKVARARGQTYYETKPFKFRKFRQPKDIRRGYLTGQPKPIGYSGGKFRSNPPRVKGRKVKGGRSVTLRNFTGTVVRKSDGTVNILGRGRRR